MPAHRRRVPVYLLVILSALGLLFQKRSSSGAEPPPATAGTATQLRTFEIPAAKPVISLAIPASWNTEVTEDRITCDSPDGGFMLRYEIRSAPPAGSDKQMALSVLQSSVDWLAEKVKRARGGANHGKLLDTMKTLAVLGRQSDDEIARLVKGQKTNLGGFAWTAVPLQRADVPKEAKSSVHSLSFAEAGNGRLLITDQWYSTDAKDSPHLTEFARIIATAKKVGP